MKIKSNKTGTISANPSDFLLRLDAGEFTSILETIAGESPEDFTSKLSGRRIEAAHRLAWCEVTEAELTIQPRAEMNQAILAELSAQRKLTDILNELMPAIELRNQKVAAASLPIRLHAHLKKNVKSIETKIAALKLRDARDFRGDPIAAVSAESELADLEDYLANGDYTWKNKDLGDHEFKAGLRDLIERGKYSGEATKKGAKQRIVDLNAQIDAVNLKVANSLTPQEVEQLNDFENEIPSTRAELADIEVKAARMKAAAERATEELKANLDTAAIIARAIIQAYHIKCGSASAAA